MAENQKMDESALIGLAADQPASEQTRRVWVTPQFECIPLSEAMGPLFNHVAQDGAHLYS